MIDKSKSQSLYRQMGLQLPHGFYKLGFDRIIHRSNNIVNNSNTNSTSISNTSSYVIHDTLKYSMDEEYDDWLVNDDGKNNINDLIKEAVVLETTGKIGFYYLDKKRTQNIFKKSGYQLPSQLKNSGSNIIIRTIDDIVNKKSIILLKANNLSDGSVICKIALQKQVKR